MLLFHVYGNTHCSIVEWYYFDFFAVSWYEMIFFLFAYDPTFPLLISKWKLIPAHCNCALFFVADLSDFEAEAKESSESGENVSPEKLSPAEESSPTSTSSPRDSKPRIWSLADIAASKPSQSVRHRPYPAPAFRPWFDATYRQFGGHPALMGNPLLVASRPSMMPAALRIPHMPPTPTSPESTRGKANGMGGL